METTKSEEECCDGPVLIKRWIGAKTVLVADSDPLHKEGEQYVDWRKRCGYTHVQSMGPKHGFHFDIWVKGADRTWIFCINDGLMSEDIIVEGLDCYLSLMAHLSPIALTSSLKGQAIEEILNYQLESIKKTKEMTETMEKLGEVIGKRTAAMMTGKRCDCEKCQPKNPKAAN